MTSVPEPVVAAKASRPWNVTFVAVLGMILTVFGLLTSLAELAFSGSSTEQIDSGQSRPVLMAVGIVGAVLAVFMFVLWLRFLKGSRLARTLLAILVVLHMVLGVFGIQSTSVTVRLTGLGAVFLFEIVVLVLMFAGQRTSAFFAKPS